MEKVMEKNTSDRILYLDFLRTIAAFAVVIIHCSSGSWSDLEVHSSSWMALLTWNSMVRWSVPIFVMISGALFLDKRKKIDFHTMKHSIVKIALAFFFWSVIYALYSMITGEIDSILSLVSAVIRGKFHLWYLFMIIGLYLIVPFLRRIFKDEKLIKPFLVLCLAFGFGIPTIQSFGQCAMFAFHNPAFIERLLNVFQLVVDDFHMHFCIEYVGYFVLGYYLSLKKTRSNGLAYVTLWLAAAVFTIFVSRWVSIKTSQICELNDNFGVNVLVMTISVFELGKLICEKCRWISRLSKYTFGIYLCHVLIRDLLEDYLHFTAISFNPWIAVPVLSITCFAISLLLVMLIRKIPLLGSRIV